MDETPIHRTTTEARAGRTGNHVRYILAISLTLTILAFLFVFLRYAQ